MFDSPKSKKQDSTADTVAKTFEVGAAASKMNFSTFDPDFCTGILIVNNF